MSCLLFLSKLSFLVTIHPAANMKEKERKWRYPLVHFLLDEWLNFLGWTRRKTLDKLRGGQFFMYFGSTLLLYIGFFPWPYSNAAPVPIQKLSRQRFTQQDRSRKTTTIDASVAELLYNLFLLFSYISYNNTKIRESCRRNPTRIV